MVVRATALAMRVASAAQMTAVAERVLASAGVGLFVTLNTAYVASAHARPIRAPEDALERFFDSAGLDVGEVELAVRRIEAEKDEIVELWRAEGMASALGRAT